MYYAEVGCGSDAAFCQAVRVIMRSWVHAAQSVNYHLPWLH